MPEMRKHELQKWRTKGSFQKVRKLKLMRRPTVFWTVVSEGERAKMKKESKKMEEKNIRNLDKKDGKKMEKKKMKKDCK